MQRITIESNSTSIALFGDNTSYKCAKKNLFT